MNLQSRDKNAAESGLYRFEKNRYFHGKLMTTRDMEAEQVYHANRLHTLARHVLGEGHVCGLETKVEETDGQLEATVTSGLAFDSRGRPVAVTGDGPIAVKDALTGEPTLPEGDEIHLFLDYDECLLESVPVPGSENACEEECCYNRILEIFEVTYTEDPPGEYKTVPYVAFPTKDDVDADEDGPAPDDPALGVMARSYYEANRAECASGDDSSVFLGSFRREGGENATWERDAGPDRRPFVYTNDMLYASIARHTADFANPHDVTAGQAGALVSVSGVTNPGGDVDLTSPDGNVAFTTEPDEVGENTVGLSVPGLSDLEANLEGHIEDFNNPHEVTVAQVGALDSVAGVDGEDGDVGLVSPDETVSIITDADSVGDHEVGLSVTGLAQLQERMAELEQRHETEIAQLTERVIRVEHYVMERSVWITCRTIGLLRDRFDDLQSEDDILRTASRFLERFEPGEPVDPTAYLEYIEETIRLQDDLLSELEEHGANPSMFRPAFEELQLAIENSDDENVLPVARAQTRLFEQLRCVHQLVID